MISIRKVRGRPIVKEKIQHKNHSVRRIVNVISVARMDILGFFFIKKNIYIYIYKIVN